MPAATGAIGVAASQPRGGDQFGASSRPPLTDTATCCGVTAPPNPDAPKRNRIAVVAVATAASASRQAHPDPSGIRTSTPTATATPINQARTASSRDPARRSQPRTVAAGTPRLAPILRCPAPLARVTNAAQISSAAYALRNNTVTGNNTCVTKHDRHRARRGRSRPPNPSTRRAWAYPQPPSTPSRHVGHPIPPVANRDSTQTESTSTVTIGASKHHSAAPRKPAKTKAGCRVPNQFLVTLTVHTNKINPATTPTTTSATSVKNGHPMVVIHKDGQQ